MWQMNVIQDNIHLFLEVVPLLLQSVSGVSEGDKRQYGQSAMGGLCAWQGAAIYNHSTQGKCPILLEAPYLRALSIFLCRRAVMLSPGSKQDASHKRCHTYIDLNMHHHGLLFFFCKHTLFLWFLPHPTYRFAGTLLPFSVKYVCPQ